MKIDFDVTIPTLNQVRVAWNEFNEIGAPWANPSLRGVNGSPISHYKAREDAWTNYCKIRDHYLHSIGVVTLADLNCKWYPRSVGYCKGRYQNN